MRNLNVEIVGHFDQTTLQNILRLQRECFPESWQYPDAREYYTQMLKDRENINLLLKKGFEIIGLLLAAPLKKIAWELVPYDSELIRVDDRYYIETIGIQPEDRGRGGARKLLIEMCKEANKRGVRNFSAHARTSNHFNLMIKNIFNGMITESRHIPSWYYGGGEPYEYIEWSCEHLNDQSSGNEK